MDTFTSFIAPPEVVDIPVDAEKANPNLPWSNCVVA